MTLSRDFLGRLQDGAFRVSYVEGALPGAFWAALCGAGGFSAFLAVALISEEYTRSAVFLRLSAVLVLIVSAFLIWAFPGRLTRSYDLFVSCVSCFVLCVVVGLLSIGPNGHPYWGGGASPAFVICLFMHYAFLRLPVVNAGAVGVCVSLVFFFSGSSILLGGEEGARTAIYLVLVNVAGLLICRHSELREFDLFQERQRVASAESEASVRADAAVRAHIEKSRVLAAVSHDIRAPLGAAKSYIELLGKGGAGNRTDRSSDLAASALDSLNLIELTLDHVLAIGQADFPHGQIPVSRIDLLPLLRRLDSTLRFEAQGKGVRLTIEIPSGYMEVVSDAGALWQVVLNLTSNAVKFSAIAGARPAAVLVRAYVRADRCFIKIFDNGIGIHRSQLNAIWEPYFRLSDGGSLGAPGLGLGLFLVQRAARALAEHSVKVRSRVGTGTIFTVEMPGCARPALSWIDKDNQLLFGCVDAGRLSGGYVVGFGGGDCDLQSTCDYLDEWGVVFERCRDIEAFQLLVSEDERALDAVLIDWDAHSSDKIEIFVDNIRRSSMTTTLLIFLVSAGNFNSLNANQFIFVKILQKPFPPQDLALAILAGVDENRRIEMEE